jgi:hypothetical protein
MPIVALPSTNIGVKNINTPIDDGIMNFSTPWNETCMVYSLLSLD